MADDLLGWVSLAVAAVALVGVVYLFIQWAYNGIAKLSFRFVRYRVGVFREDQRASNPQRIVLDFSVWNRTFDPQRVKCDTGILLSRTFLGTTYAKLRNVELVDDVTDERLNPRRVEIAPRSEKRLFLFGDIPTGYQTPCKLYFFLGDDRAGRRHWQLERDFELREVDKDVMPYLRDWLR